MLALQSRPRDTKTHRCVARSKCITWVTPMACSPVPTVAHAYAHSPSHPYCWIDANLK